MQCPICEKPTVRNDNPFRPFCSERCQMVDLGTWFDEGYSVPDETASLDEIEEVGARQSSKDETRLDTRDNRFEQ